jgi:hypothetical protein
MGSLIYGSAGIEIGFDDRVLAHLEHTFTSKLRRHEPFLFSWKDDPAVGDGRSAVWIDQGVPIYFRYSGSKTPVLNREWLEELLLSASSSRGLVLSQEPGPGGMIAQSTDNSVKRRDHPAR